jgi:hypothetical protein
VGYVTCISHIHFKGFFCNIVIQYAVSKMLLMVVGAHAPIHYNQSSINLNIDSQEMDCNTSTITQVMNPEN